MKHKKKIILFAALTACMVLFCSMPVFAAELTEADVEQAVASQGKEAVTGNVFVWFLCAIAFLKVSQKIDSFMASLGINVGNTGGNMMAELLIAGRNQIGLTTQMPAVMEIVTNKESTKGRMVTVGGQSIRLKRPAITVTQENADLLQVIDAIGQMDRYAELEKADALALFRNYIREKEFSQTQLAEILPAVTGTTAKKLIEGGLIYEFSPG